MSRHTPALSTEQADLAAMLSALVADAEERPRDEQPDDAVAIRRRLAELGVWTLGAATDGDQVSDELTALAFAGVARGWPALAWASVQAHAAVDVLGDSVLSSAIQAGENTVAVVDDTSAAVRLTTTDGRVSGRIDRIDPAGERPHVVVLGHGTAQVFPPDALRFEQVRRTGLDGALTCSVELAQPVAEADVVIDGVDTDAARIRLRLGAAAVAAGIADAAAEAALKYSREREQFGAPLTALPSVRDTLLSTSGSAARVLRQVLRARDCTVWQAAEVLDSACEQAIDACTRAVQAHGGYGYLTEYHVGSMLRDAVSLRASCDVWNLRCAAATDYALGSVAGSGKGSS
ncbi:acyl-CoA dehydrogenase family protein [Streptomyces anthocyanicus]|uniref:acyl-CoA dehydrogenase family protein n=1 Tax=Streptomyces anthocyanicus TaxID=68174 RepID=UPI002F90A445|nr:acyl-CoA/acyl-ACP dehydrogenase [Streptomyces anthocyanicus]